MSKNILFHSPYPLDRTLDSGSKVRPLKMYDAFESLGYEVIPITGDPKERLNKFFNVLREGRTVEFCYSEPSTWPVHPAIDYTIYSYLKLNKVPTGIFYRDIYWKFPEMFNEKAKTTVMRHKSDLALFNYICSIMFVPSKSFGDYLGVGVEKRALPPGGTDQTDVTKDTDDVDRAIYVGGVSQDYGTGILAESLNILNRKHDLQLDLVCRESDFNTLSGKIRSKLDKEWISLHHVSGDNLQTIYKDADVGIIPRIPNEYYDMAMPVKLFEYLSFGLPIVATDCNEMGGFIRSNECGLISEPTARGLANAINCYITDKEQYQHDKEMAVRTLREGHTWEHRAREVADSLISAHPD